MQAIDDRLHRGLAAGVAAGTSFGRKQRTPQGFNDPVDDPLGMGDAQRGNGWEGMENVAHGAQTDHEQTELGLSLQSSIFSQVRMRTTHHEAPNQPFKSGRFIFDLDSQVRGEDGQIVWEDRNERPEADEVFFGGDERRYVTTR